MSFSTDPARRKLEYAVFDLLKDHFVGAVRSDSKYECACGRLMYWPEIDTHRREVIVEFVLKWEQGRGDT